MIVSNTERPLETENGSEKQELVARCAQHGRVGGAASRSTLIFLVKNYYNFSLCGRPCMCSQRGSDRAQGGPKQTYVASRWGQVAIAKVSTAFPALAATEAGYTYLQLLLPAFYVYSRHLPGPRHRRCTCDVPCTLGGLPPDGDNAYWLGSRHGGRDR